MYKKEKERERERERERLGNKVSRVTSSAHFQKSVS